MFGRETSFLFLLLATACGAQRADPSRVVHIPPTPTIEPTQSPATVHVQPWHWRQGRWDGPKLTTAPTVHWSGRLGGPIIHPLTTDGQRVFAVAAGTLFAHDLAGEPLWKARIDADGPAVVSPAGLTIGTHSGDVFLLEPETGDVLEKRPSTSRARTAVLPLADTYAWISVDGELRTFSGHGYHLTGSPVTDAASDGQHMYVSTIDSTVLALTKDAQVWQASIPGPGIGNPVIGPDTIYVPYGSSRGTRGGIAALDRRTGGLRWDSSLDFEPGAPPALGALLVVPGKRSELVAMDPTHGGVRWRAPGYAEFSATPAIVEDAVYAGNADGRMHRMDMTDGGEAWAVELGSPVTGDPVAVKGWLIVGLTDGRLVGLRSP